MNQAQESRRVQARPDGGLSARVIRRLPIVYASGADPRLDRPSHVRAASGLVWVGERLAVVQDDANFVALVDPTTGEAEAVALPPGPGGHRQFDDGRGNKADKLDLEALASVPRPGGTLLVAFGSGSTPRRECVVVIGRLGRPDFNVAVHSVPAVYAKLRAADRFAGSELNVEGALHVAGRIRLFGRGNGAPRDGVSAIDATCDLDCRQLLDHLERPDAVPAPAPENIVQYDLGTLGGVRLGFTDAAASAGIRGELDQAIFTAAAEASPDATRDGPVAGSAIGIIDESSRGIVARWTELRDAEGRPFPGKIEGIAIARVTPGRAFVVVDHDAHALPSELCEVALDGRWLVA